MDASFVKKGEIIRGAINIERDWTDCVNPKIFPWISLLAEPEIIDVQIGQIKLEKKTEQERKKTNQKREEQNEEKNAKIEKTAPETPRIIFLFPFWERSSEKITLPKTQAPPRVAQTSPIKELERENLPTRNAGINWNNILKKSK